MVRKCAVMASLFATMLLLLGSAAPANDSYSLSRDESLIGKRVVMGTSADYPPFEYIKNGNIIGFDVDIARMVAKELGINLEIKDMEFSALLASIQSGHADFVMATVTASEERRKHVDFSDVYYSSPVTMVVREADHIATMQDLSNKTVGVQLGSTWESFAKQKKKDVKSMNILSINKGPQMLEELKLGRVDAILVDRSQAEYFVRVSVGTKMITMLDERADGYVMMFPKGSPLRVPFNKVLKELKKKGRIEELEHKWLVQKASDVVF